MAPALLPPEISDQNWFEAISHPERAGERFGFVLPSFPPDNVQKRYNGQHGEAALNHAFAIYRCFKRHLPARHGAPRVMDFGAGWGRVARFFLKDTAPENIWAVDPLVESVDWMRKTGLPCTIVKSEPLPPIPGTAAARFDLIYANSVFSHLSEKYFNAWIPALLALLAPQGRLVFTSRGHAYLDQVERQSQRPGWRQRAVFGDLARLRERYAAGEFIFLRNRGDEAPLSGSYFGHALVPKAYFEKNYPGCLVEFADNVPGMNQAVFVASNRV